MDTYNRQANNLLSNTGVEMTVQFIEHGKHFADDKDNRDIYQITLKRGEREYTFRFGQSIMRSGHINVKGIYGRNTLKTNKIRINSKGNKPISRIEAVKHIRKLGGFSLKRGFDWDINENSEEPTAYDVLACLTKYDVGSLEDFCSEFGYDTDSIKANETYKAVKDEYSGVCSIFNVDEMEQLREIQ